MESFITWLTNYGDVVYFVAQMGYWLGMLLFIGYAVYQYKRWVNFQLGTGKSGALRTERTAAGADEPETAVSVEEFVE